jgi:hypothetical protein
MILDRFVKFVTPKDSPGSTQNLFATSLASSSLPIPAPIRFAVEEYGHHPHVRPYLPPRVQPQRPIVAEASEFRRFGAVAEVGGEVRETVEVDLRRNPLVVPGR